MNHILYSDDIKRQIVEEINHTTDNLHIVTAYCKNEGIKFIEENLRNPISSKRLMVRFTFDDIVSGASDLSVYEFCKRNGWDMYVRFDLHAKTYIFDRKRWVVGSANLTSRGLGLASVSNYEMAVLADIEPDEMYKIESLFNSAFRMTDEIYQKMQECISRINTDSSCSRKNWDEDILSLFVPDISVLFTYDLPPCISPRNLPPNALEFLSIPAESSMDEIKMAFRWSKTFIWLTETLKKTSAKEMYFGTLTEALHNILVNDPKPYRKEVKELQQNLLNWVVELNMENIIIDRPNFSQRIKYTGY